MASKAKKRSKKVSVDTLFAQAQAQLEKGGYRQALKDAKVLFRRAATEEHRRLLEFASIARAEDLRRQRNRTACQGVLESLLELGVSEPAVQTALPDLLLWSGMLDRLPADHEALSGQNRAVWDQKVADQAVLDPDRTSRCCPVIREAAQRVRDALDLLYEGGVAATDLRLKDIPRDSPLADWKLLVRGLAAYYEEDFDRMRDNWSRLDPERVASRIARRLLALTGERQEDLSDMAFGTAVRQLEQATGAPALFSRLRMLRQQLGDGQLNKALPALREICRDLRQFDPPLERRLVRCVCDQLVRDGRVSEVESLAKLVDPLPLDPRWNRARALVREQADDSDPEDSLPFWRSFTRDVAESAELEPPQRKVAQALVWLHMARTYLHRAKALQHCPCGRAHDEETQAAVEQAEECLELCFKLAPSHLAGYRTLVDLYESAKQPDKVNMAYRRLLEQAPDEIDALVHLAHHHLIEDEPVLAQQYAQQAVRAKPLDPQMKMLLWLTHLSAARAHALQGDFDHGRREFQLADDLLPARRTDYDVLGKKAVLEIKAGAAARARELVIQAQEAVEEPAPLWLLMTIEAARYRLPREEAWLYEKRWADALKRRCRGSTAGAMCKLVFADRRMRGASCDVAPNLVQQLGAYLERCSRVKWQLDDLRNVCTLLVELDNDKLLRRYVNRGLKTFRDAAYFHFLDAQLEMKRGPFRCRRGMTRKSLLAALKLAQKSKDPVDQEIVEPARVALTLLDEMPHRPGGRRWFRFNQRDHDEDHDPHLPIPRDGMRPEERMAMFETVCNELGLDPEVLLADAAERSGLPGNPSGSGRKSDKTQRRRKRRPA